MAQNNQPIVARSKLLPNNSAAEFVELRVDRYLGPDFARPNGTEFSPDLDQFVTQETAASMKVENYYQASKHKAKEFEALLVKFSKLVDDRQLGKRFDISSKNPDAYRMEDVLEIAEKVQNKHRNTSTVRTCTGIFRKCFDSVGRNQGALNNLLSFIPNDSYGSIIFGGFTLILTAIERAEKLREKAYTALAEVPRKLELITSLTECHHKSVEVYQAGDSVLVALFEVLERIINELTKSKGRTSFARLMKGDSYGTSMDAALVSLERKLEEFKNQVFICNSRRLGEIGESQSRVETDIKRILNSMADANDQFKTAKASAAALQSSPTTTIEEQNAIIRAQLDATKKEELLNFLTHLYRFLTSNPNFDSHTGGCLPAVPRSIPEESHKVQTEKLAKHWLDALPLQFHSLAIQDMGDLLNRSTSLSIEDQGKVQYIMTSPHLIEWLKTNESKILLLQSEIAPQDLINPLSFSSAFLAKTMRETHNSSPVLYYNCEYRSIDSLDRKEKSGPLALINTLNSQLVQHLLTSQGETVNLSCLEHDRTAKHTLKRARNLFKSLLEELPETDLVFIVVDGLSRITGEDESVDKVFRGLLRLASRSRKRSFKLLLTDILSRTVLDDYEYLEIFLPSRVDFGGQSLNLGFLSEETQNSMSLNP